VTLQELIELLTKRQKSEDPEDEQSEDPEDEQSEDPAELAGTELELAKRLHTELVRADGRLADPTDLPFDPAHLEDSDALTKAIEEYLRRRPGARARKVGGNVGAGNRGTPTPTRAGLINVIRGMK